MLGNNILKLLRPVLEDETENVTNNLNENFQFVLIKIPSLVLLQTYTTHTTAIIC